MRYLVFATIIWAFSFSLIGVYLSGEVDPFFAAWLRIVLATLAFLPLLLKHRVPFRKALLLTGIGAVQLGLMYVFYYQSFELLSVPEVLVFTIFTPIYVTLIHDVYQRRFTHHYLLTAALAVLGTAVIRWGAISTSFVIGFLVVQASNFCFAFGQVSYKRFHKGSTRESHHDFGYFYVGALVVSSIAYLVFGTQRFPSTSTQWTVLLWLGFVASGLGYFLWNLGARKVNAGALAIMNNALVPAGLLVNVLIWNREVEWFRLGIGSIIIIISLWLNQRWVPKPNASPTPQAQ